LLGRAAATASRKAFSSKKGEWLNPLKSLNPKRQIQAVNRQKRAIYRQKGLALLSEVCQSPDCSVTKSEGENANTAPIIISTVRSQRSLLSAVCDSDSIRPASL